jgi:hypothetical protein
VNVKKTFISCKKVKGLEYQFLVVISNQRTKPFSFCLWSNELIAHLHDSQNKKKDYGKEKHCENKTKDYGKKDFRVLLKIFFDRKKNNQAKKSQMR